MKWQIGTLPMGESRGGGDCISGPPTGKSQVALGFLRNTGMDPFKGGLYNPL